MAVTLVEVFIGPTLVEPSFVFAKDKSMEKHNLADLENKIKELGAAGGDVPNCPEASPYE
jgi:hypothetical protein